MHFCHRNAEVRNVIIAQKRFGALNAIGGWCTPLTIEGNCIRFLTEYFDTNATSSGEAKADIASPVARLALRTWLEVPIVCRINHWLWDLFLSHLSTELATVLKCFARNSRIDYVVLSPAKFRQFKCSSDLFCLLSTSFLLFAPIAEPRVVSQWKWHGTLNMIIKLTSKTKCAPPKFIVIIHYAKWWILICKICGRTTGGRRATVCLWRNGKLHENNLKTMIIQNIKICSRLSLWTTCVILLGMYSIQLNWMGNWFQNTKSAKMNRINIDIFGTHRQWSLRSLVAFCWCVLIFVYISQFWILRR